MTQILKMSEAERKVYRLANFRDGFWDISLGLILMEMSIYPLTRNLLGPIWNLVLILALTLGLVFGVHRLRLKIVAPRVGLEKFGDRTKRKLKTAHFVTLAIVMATLVVWIFSAGNRLREPIWRNLPKWVSDFDVDLLFAAIIIAIFSVIALTLSVPRYYLYGVLMVYRDAKFHYPLLIAGMVVLAVGILVLSCFVKAYSLSQEDV